MYTVNSSYRTNYTIIPVMYARLHEKPNSSDVSPARSGFFRLIRFVTGLCLHHLSFPFTNSLFGNVAEAGY